MQLKTELAFQFKSKSLKDIFLMLGNYQFATTRQQDLSNSAFGHLRYNRSLLPYLKYELFNQIQFNQLLNLRSRYIAGTGLRFKFSNKQVFKGYFGIGGFYEYEESIEDVRVFRNDFRQSNYLVLSIKFPNNKGEFSSTTYYQPLFKKYSDFRVSNQSSLVFNITKKIAFTTTFSYFYDAFPPEDIAKETISIDNGLRFQF